MPDSEKISEAKRAEEILSESEEHFRALAEAATDGIITINAGSTILFVNPAAEKIFGYSNEEMLGQPLTMLMPEYLRHLHEKGITRYVETGRKHIGWSAVQLPGLHKNGAQIPLEISFGEFTKGNQRFFTGIVRDITEWKRLEERLARSRRHVILHAKVNAAFSEGEQSLRTVLQRCAEAVVRNLDAAFARIWTLNSEGNQLDLQASAGLYTHLDGEHAHFAVGANKIGLIAAERKPHVTNDVLSDERISDKDWAEKKGMVAFAGYPLLVEGRVVGVIAMFARSSLEKDTTAALESIAPIIARGIKRERAQRHSA